LSAGDPLHWLIASNHRRGTTTTTTGSGTITEFAPGERFVIKESSGPVRYKVRKDVTYVTKSGKTLTADEVTTRVKIGVPVSVHYVKEGDDMFVNRVIIDGD